MTNIYKFFYSLVTTSQQFKLILIYNSKVYFINTRAAPTLKFQVSKSY